MRVLLGHNDKSTKVGTSRNYKKDAMGTKQWEVSNGEEVRVPSRKYAGTTARLQDIHQL